MSEILRKLRAVATLPSRATHALEVVAQNYSDLYSDLFTRLDRVGLELERMRSGPRNAQLLLLWSRFESETDAEHFPQAKQRESPCCAAVGFDVRRRSHVAFEQLMLPVPAGAWLVAIGCTMHTVMVGIDIQTATLGAKLRVARLRDPIKLGVQLTAQVEPEETPER